MLQKDNKWRVLEVFFEDPIPSGGVYLREISRKLKLAPTSVKRYLSELEKDSLIVSRRLHGYPTYFANRDFHEFKFLKRVNNMMLVKDSGLLDYLHDKLAPEAIVLFGSASRGEDIARSDIDLFLLCKEKGINLSRFQNLLHREINLIFAKDFSELNPELKNNIINGIIMRGYLKVF